MLKRHNRIVSPEDFRQVVRRGRKHVMTFVVVYRRPSELCRVGVIITTRCGGAVVRNLLRRRTHALCRDLVETGHLTGDTIIRFRCEGVQPTYAELKKDLVDSLAT